jgi:diguanylate cyclase (GGDEF)-like protein
MEDTQKISILIVDDDSVYLEALKEILQDTYSVHVAETGSSAITLAENTQPDIIFLDVVLPGMTGFDVFEALQENETTRGIPVIFISGLTDIEEQERGFLLGAADFIQKPCSKVIVHQKIKTRLMLVEYAQTINKLGLLDPLTGLPIKKRLCYYINEEWRRNCRYKMPISFLAIDIDNFRDFNQEYGYALGDEAIKKVASICKQAIRRPADTAAKLEGGTFGLMLPETDLAGAKKIAEDIQAGVKGLRLDVLNSEEKPAITVSIGVSAVIPEKEDLMGDMDKVVDDFVNDTVKKMRDAKTEGKNQILS